MNVRDRYRAAFDQWADRAENTPLPGPREHNTPLTASQHILHLLLTVFTAGLWLPVWFIRAWQGNRPPAH